ncbi:MAG: fatty acid desaturase family protein [Tepidisphaeraceae bacterium]
MPTRPPVKFAVGDTFQKTLRARIDRYFRFTGRSPRDCPQMYLKTGIILSWLIASYVLLVFVDKPWWVAVPLAVALGMGVAAVGFNVQHDGGHKAYSRFNWINRLMAMSLDLLGGSSYIWNLKHNTIHHTYANITDHDDDINVGFLGRLSPHQPRRKFHRLQHWYLWPLYGFLPPKWHFVDDFLNTIRGRIGTHHIARPKGRELAIFLGGKAVFFTLAFVVPALFHPIWMVVLFYLMICWIEGIVLSVVFQLAHVVEEAEFPMPDHDTGHMEKHWAVHQVETTVDFARTNPFLTWFLGGLNFQVEHHLFPRISHIHYPRISRMVERACREFGLRYNAHKSLFDGVASHFRWLRRMGQPVT